MVRGLTHLTSCGETNGPELFQPRDVFVGNTLMAASSTSRLFVKRWTSTVVQGRGLLWLRGPEVYGYKLKSKCFTLNVRRKIPIVGTREHQV